jgi:hypothetical protein
MYFYLPENTIYVFSKTQKYKGYFPAKIDIQTRISGVQPKTQNFYADFKSEHRFLFIIIYYLKNN